MFEFKPLGRKLTTKQIGELESRDFLGDETWIKWKQELDSLLSYRKSFKGKPSEEQLAQLDANKDRIEFLNSMLFHSEWLAIDGGCDCVRCVKKGVKK